MDANETKKILAMVAATYANATLNEATAAIWGRIFKELPFATVEAAFFEYAKTPNRFAPAPGEILEIIRQKARRSVEPVDDVWNEILSIAGSGSPGRRELLSDAAKSAMRQVGWRNVAMAHTEKELPWIKKRFVELYENYIDRELLSKLPHYIGLKNNTKELNQ